MYSYTNSPYKNIPDELLKDYTMNNNIPILDWWLDGSGDLRNKIWNKNYIDEFKQNFTSNNIKNNNHGHEPYPGASSWILKAIEKYNIKNQKIAVIGSLTPWIEAILLNFDNIVTTVEYNVPTIDYPNLNSISYWDFQKNTTKYDCIITYSSIKHSGLGRYGDPLDPNGDVHTMQEIHKNLVNNGLLIWGAPVGHDALVWNVHRIYGKIRLPLIFNGFKELEWIDFDKDILLNSPLNKSCMQPVIVLSKIT
jgi:hypothetical protein